MKRSTGLKRTTPLKRGTPKPRRASGSRPPKTVRDLVWTRDDAACVRCGLNVSGRPHSIHHRVLRGQGGSHTPDNLITLCGIGSTLCHGWVHENRAEARDNGWILYPGDNPAEMPLLLRSAAGAESLVLLTADGRRADPGEAVAA